MLNKQNGTANEENSGRNDEENFRRIIELEEQILEATPSDNWCIGERALP